MKYITLLLFVMVILNSCGNSNSAKNGPFKEYEDLLTKQIELHDQYISSLKNVESYEDFEKTSKNYNNEMKMLGEQMAVLQSSFDKKGPINSLPPSIEKLMKKIERQQEEDNVIMKELEPKLTAIMSKKQGEHRADPDHKTD